MAPAAEVGKHVEMDWPADHVERWDITRLIPYARNARLHTEAQVAQIAASMREWGWTMPILVDEEGTIIAGHGRVAAALLLGYTSAPVMIARGWSEAKKRAYVLADNKLALNAGWDPELLAVELSELKDFHELIGFSATELDELLKAGSFGATSEADQGRLDQVDPITCPSCGHQFTR